MSENIVLDKSLDFALRIVKLCHYLNEDKREFVLSKELLISGTNIGRHVRAAIGAENRETFISEFGIARRRALETEYWLLVLFHGEILTEHEYNSIEADRLELVKIISSIHSSSRHTN
ncbi:MAG TPA: four helix bundle protein [Pyrinomonadaceae bacterium]|nr:four helix bundle protein [Pyrinomonadaceae bacterium]HMU34765.1 four helix bundle protein [Pyrinomonadaceae bacterium]